MGRVELVTRKRLLRFELLDHRSVRPDVDEVLDVLVSARVAEFGAGEAVVRPQGEHEPRKGFSQLANHLANRSQGYPSNIPFTGQEGGEE